MKFYDREEEVNLLERIGRSNGVRVVIVKGLRRMGKTTLALNWLNDKEYAYIFVPKDKTIGLFLEEACAELKIPRFNDMIDFVRYIFEKYEYVFFDEFQNFYHVDKSVYSLFQKLIDEFSRKDKKLCLLISGSSYSLMNKIFSDYSKALYGRKDIEMTLLELNVRTSMEILSDLGIKSMEEKIMFWSVFGGMPKFYVQLEKLKIKNYREFEDLFLFASTRSMLNEGKSVLVSEFGGEYKTYYSIMEAIACSRNTLSEIASVFENDPGATNRYIDLLRTEYGLIGKKTPLTGGNKSKRGIYFIRNNFLAFWFRFIKRNESFYEQDRIEEVKAAYSEGFNAYVGRAFEDFCMGLLREGIVPAPFQIAALGGEWGTFKGEKGRNAYEIDIVAVNDKEKKALFCECKWKDDVDAKSAIEGLKEKAGFVEWNKGQRKEYFAVFAKSFGKRIDEKGVSCFDLKDIEKAIAKRYD